MLLFEFLNVALNLMLIRLRIYLFNLIMWRIIKRKDISVTEIQDGKFNFFLCAIKGKCAVLW